MREKSYWQLVSPLPDIPSGTTAVHIHGRRFGFGSENGRWLEFDEDEMKRNPAIFKWVQQKKEWPNAGEVGWHMGLDKNGPPNVMILCKSVEQGLDVIQAVQSLFANKRREQNLGRPDGSVE